jgi:hypothetical protein
MTIDESDRSKRVAGLIADLPVEDLRRTTLQAIDHAYKSAAEVAQAWATYEGALGTIAELKDENRRLRERIETIETRGLGITHRAKRSAANAAEQARSVRKRQPS